MQSTDLEFFMAVSREASIGGAALKLNTAQSNVTNRIKKLEADLGVVLFERHSRGVKPTAAAERLLPFAAEVSRLLREARFSVTAGDAPRGPLLIGAMETTMALRLSGRLVHFSRLYPEVDLSLRTGTTAELVEQVLHQELEGAYVCGPIAHPRLMARRAFMEDLAIVAGPDVASLDTIVERGHANIYVFRRGCSYRQRLEQILARRGIAVARTLEYGSLDAILACVSAGMGVTLLPLDLLKARRPAHDLSVLRLPEAEAQVETLFIRRAQAYVSPALTAFLGSVDTGATPPAAPVPSEEPPNGTAPAPSQV
ncbi:LysR family transcriptional regulator [Xanthobacter agilis]|uniref:DNA-binding transcriptional LysR family regulator n=1 Tax=Xanthobacter agilis TaxID=47492 RepID=A0ABU0LJZ8_XANAG|nr:LysR family transcriptional regulator [Xanthobacter agilis]MDQ0507462.1 DNA-binding transcriptional LysR family regulator [Xanthobacter agilis]